MEDKANCNYQPREIMSTEESWNICDIYLNSSKTDSPLCLATNDFETFSFSEKHRRKKIKIKLFFLKKNFNLNFYLGELDESLKEGKSSSPESSGRRTGSEESDEVAASLSSVGHGVSQQLVHAQLPFGKFYPALSAAQEVTKQLVRRPSR